MFDNLTNIAIVLFIFVASLLWGKYGMFSAFLHFILVILSGAIAFGTWEVVAEALLGVEGIVADNAWGLSLIFVFVFTLLALRIATDKLAKQNMHFTPQLDNLGGMLFGASTGIITAGILLFGICNLHVSDLWGYKPLVFQDGKMKDNQLKREPVGRLWVPVDKITSQVFIFLSDGSLFPTFGKHTLASTRVDLKVQANSTVSSEDIHSKQIVTNEAFKINHVYTVDMKQVRVGRVRGLGVLAQQQAGSKIILVETQWERLDHLSDVDHIIRLYPEQISLVGEKTSKGKQTHTLYKPIAVTSQDSNSKRYIIPFDDYSNFAWISFGQAKVYMLFVVEDDFKPTNLLLCNTRRIIKDVTQSDLGTKALRAVLRYPHYMQRIGAKKHITKKTYKGSDQGVRVSRDLPATISRAGPGASALSFSHRKIKKREVYSVSGGSSILNLADPGHKRAAKSKAVRRLAKTRNRTWIRTRMSSPVAKARYSSIRRDSGKDFAVRLVLDDGTVMYPMGYALFESYKTMVIQVGSEVKSIRNFPWSKMKNKTELFLYFSVPTGSTVTGYYADPKQMTKLHLVAEEAPRN